jgi:DNA-binding CsgD family transcriptional regulator
MGDMIDLPVSTILCERCWLMTVRFLSLSARESELVQHILIDQSERAIADSLGLSPHTVHTYLERLYRKLRVTSRCQLVTRVFLAHIAVASTCGCARVGQDVDAARRKEVVP